MAVIIDESGRPQVIASAETKQQVLAAEAKPPMVIATGELRGPAGPEGPMGPVGLQGLIGPQGAQGLQGPQGIQGTQGEQGIQGETGEGLRVIGILANSGLLPSSGNAVGDGYIIGLNLWVWTSGASWLNTGPIQGPQGDTGAQGIQGIQGEVGPQGPIGLTGNTGPQGIQGIQGIQGPIGVTGNTGPIGPQGIKGDTGDVGPTGPMGGQETLVSGTNIKTINGQTLLGAGDMTLNVSLPITTKGDLLVGDAAGAPARLPVGTPGKILGVASGVPAWVDPPAGGAGLAVTTFAADFTLGLTNVNNHIRSTSATSTQVTIPPQSSVAWAANTEMRFEQGGSGPITFLAGAGVTISKKPDSVLKSAYRNCLITLKRTAEDAWSLLGEVAPINTTCAVRSTEHAAIASGVTSIVVNKPAGTVDGDIMVMFVQGEGNGTLASTGWTSRTSVGWVGGCSAILTKTASSEPASWTVTQTNSGVLNVRVVTVSGAAAVDLNSTLLAPHSSNPRTIASINPTADGLLLAGFFNAAASPTISKPVTMDIVGALVNSGYSNLAVYSEKVPAGATGTRVANWSSPSGSTEAMIVIR